MATAQKKETNIKTLKDVIFMYSSVSEPQKQLNEENKPPLSDSPLEFHSYEVKILIAEERFKKLKKEFKGAKNFANAKEFEKEEFLEANSYLNADDLADDMVLIKFSQSCLRSERKTGNRIPTFPIKQIGIKGQVQDNNGINIDFETNTGNGTKGHFQFRPVVSDFGLYLYPHLICVTDLVEYTSAAEEDLDSLGLEELGETDVEAAGEAHAEEQAPAPVAEDEDEDDFPF
tara:strand:- start:928 stop:1620 length:693 start_codon:yes stop_codon:yes gene_type:complete